MKAQRVFLFLFLSLLSLPFHQAFAVGYRLEVGQVNLKIRRRHSTGRMIDQAFPPLWAPLPLPARFPGQVLAKDGLRALSPPSGRIPGTASPWPSLWHCLSRGPFLFVEPLCRFPSGSWRVSALLSSGHPSPLSAGPLGPVSLLLGPRCLFSTSAFGPRASGSALGTRQPPGLHSAAF